jgi:hypothetical protein
MAPPRRSPPGGTTVTPARRASGRAAVASANADVGCSPRSAAAPQFIPNLRGRAEQPARPPMSSDTTEPGGPARARTRASASTRGRPPLIDVTARRNSKSLADTS